MHSYGLIVLNSPSLFHYRYSMLYCFAVHVEGSTGLELCSLMGYQYMLLHSERCSIYSVMAELGVLLLSILLYSVFPCKDHVCGFLYI